MESNSNSFNSRHLGDEISRTSIDSSKSYARREIEQLLEYFNQQQQSPDKALQLTREWCKRLLEKLQLDGFRDLLSINAAFALSCFSDEIRDEDDKRALEQLFAFHLPKYRLEILSKDVFDSLRQFTACKRSDIHESLATLAKNVNTLKQECNSDEKFAKILEASSHIEPFKKACLELLLNDQEGLSVLINDLLAKLQSLSPIRKELAGVLHIINLIQYMFLKISVNRLTEITLHSKDQSGEDSAWKLLRGLTACNYKARNEAGSPHADTRQAASQATSLRERSRQKQAAEGLHPMDILFASFLCCDAEAKQFLCQRLFACKLAFPFLYMDELNKLVQSDWILRDICLEFQGQNGEPVETSLGGDLPLPIVSFMRVGDLRLSKSKVLNHLLDSEYHDTFFNRSSENGRVRRACTDGLVEAAVSLPTRSSSGPAFLALNLRGDMMRHLEQADRMLKLSQCCVLFVCGCDLGESATLLLQTIRNVREKVSRMIVVISDRENHELDIDKVFAVCEGYVEPMKIFAVLTNLQDKWLSELEVTKEIATTLLQDLLNGPCQSLSNTGAKKLVQDVSGKAATRAYELHIELRKHKDDISSAFPVQGQLWRDISKVQRELAKSKDAKKSNQLLQTRQNLLADQIAAFKSDSCTKLFLSHMNSLEHIERQNYLQILQLLLEDSTRKTAPALRQESLRLKLQMESKMKYCAGSASSESKQELQELQKNVMVAGKQLEDCSFQRNKIFREVGLVYEAHAHMNGSDMPDDIRKLPRLFASLLLSGIPLELLDGNSGNIPLKWVSAVLHECEQLVGDKRLFVVSVLGTQSTGKSTLLNTMFGLRLPVSCGRCTRGAFLQLVPVGQSSQLPFQYLAVVDTEGLRAVDLGTNQFHHDNELATLVIGLADLTLITVHGDDSPEIRDVLQIVIHAFISMKKSNTNLDLKRRCVFVHRDVSDTSGMQKLKSEILGRQSMLDEITTAAAEKEGVSGVTCFSDIIAFSPDSDTFLMPALWHGDPPMAPVNVRFANEVLRLKKYVIGGARDTLMTPLKFSDFRIRTLDIWNAVLTEDFAFNFRNSIEMKAYRVLEEGFSQIRSESKTKLRNYLATIILRVKQLGSPNDVNQAVSEEIQKLSVEVECVFSTARRNLKAVFTESEYKQFMVQWETGKMASLDNAKEEIKHELTGRLYDEGKLQLLNIEQDEAVEGIQRHLMDEADRLAKSRSGGVLTAKIIHDIFQSKWEKILNEMKQKPISRSVDIEQKLKEKLRLQFPGETEGLLSRADVCLPASEVSNINDLLESLHSDLKELYTIVEQPKSSLSSVQWMQAKAEHIMDHIRAPSVVLMEAKMLIEIVKFWLSQTVAQNRPFRDSDANSVVDFVSDQFDKTSEHLRSKGIELTSLMKAAVAVHACRMAFTAFSDMETEFLRAHSLQAKLEDREEHMFKIFKNQAMSRFSEVAFNIIKDICETALIESIKCKAESLLKKHGLSEQKFLRNKKLLIKLMLQRCIEGDKDLTELYIRDPKAAAAKFIQDAIEKLLFSSSGTSQETCKYLRILESHLLNPALNALAGALKQAGQSTSPESWVQKLCSACLTSELPVRRDKLDKICKDAKLDIKDLSIKLKKTFSEIRKPLLEKIKTDVISGDNHEKLPGMKDLYSHVLTDLWGCKHRCPLCKEPCIEMDAEHVRNDKTKHRCIQHRPLGLTGAPLTEENEFALYSCNYFATKISTLLQGVKSLAKKNKKFRCTNCQRTQSDCKLDGVYLHKCYNYMDYFPDWDIEPDFSAPVSDMWKWLAYSNRDSLVKQSKVYSKIPDEWEKSKESAKKCLSQLLSSGILDLEDHQKETEAHSEVV